MWSSSKIHFRTTSFSVIYKWYAASCWLWTIAMCWWHLIFQHKHITEIESALNKNFSMLCGWFVDNKLSIHAGEDKAKSILFGSKHKIKKSKALNVQYNDIKIKHYSRVTYLGWIFDETLSGESMSIHVINKINSRLGFAYRQNSFLNFPLRRLLCNVMIKPFFDYACNAWYPSINKKLKMCWQAAPKKCIRFCLKLNDRSSIKSEDFGKINWLLIHERVSKCSLCSMYKFFTKNFPNYFDVIHVPLDTNGVHMRSSYQKLNVPNQKTDVGQNVLSCLCWSFALEQFK